MLSTVGVTTSAQSSDPRRLRLRYPAFCANCGIALSKGAEAYWSRAERKATCLACAPRAGETDPGTAGASAAAEGERRKNKRVEDVRRQHGDLAAEVAEEMAARDVAASWAKGSAGESRLASFIKHEVGDLVIPLHDRLIPGHVGTSTTSSSRRPASGSSTPRHIKGGWSNEKSDLSGTARMSSGSVGRNRTKLANGLDKQVAAVLAALKRDSSFKGTNVHAALCLVESEWALLDSPFQIGNVWVLYAGALRKRLKKSGPLSRETMERIAHRLDLSLPHATAIRVKRSDGGRHR